MISISNILRDSKYNLSQFSDEKIQQLQDSIISKPSKTGDLPYVTCLVRKKDIKLTPEEIVRQLYLMTLYEDFGYPFERMQVEYPVAFGREKKRADIVIFDKDHTTSVYIVNPVL